MSDPFQLAAGFVTAPRNVVVIVATIFLWAFLAWLIFVGRMRPVLRSLRAALRTLKGSADQAAFASDYEAMREALQNNRTLAHAWSEFEEVLLPDPSSSPPVVRNTRAPSEYFTRNTVVGGHVDLRFFNSLPNLFTGVGILGTFVGLVAGIYLAGQGLASDDPTVVKTALQELLGGASLAFLTSIAGLLSSLLFNVAEKRKLHALDKLISQWVTGLDHRLQRVTVESIASEQLREFHQQRLVLEQFSSELAFQIADEIGKKFSGDLSPTLEKLVAAVEGMRDQRRDDTSEMIQRMANDFQDSLADSAGKELAALGEAVSTVTRELRGVSTDTANRLSEMAERLGATVDQINEVLQRAGEIALQNQKIAQDNQTTIASLDEVGDRFERIIEPVSQSVTAIGQSATSLEQTSQQIQGSHEQMRAAVAQIAELQDKVRETWENYEQRFGELDESLAKTFRELESGLSQYIATVNDFVGGLDKSTASITQSLAGAANELRETLEEAQDTFAEQRAQSR